MMPRMAEAALAAMLATTPLGAVQAGEMFPLTSLEGVSLRGVNAEPAMLDGLRGLRVTVAPDHKSVEEGGCDGCTFVALEEIDFAHGTIEIDVAGAPIPGSPAWARGFVGVVFRADLEADRYEGVYLRPMNAHASAQIQRNHTTQYFSYPDHPWFELREESPGHYESYAPVEVGEWTRMRIDVDGASMRLFLDGAEQPALVVDDLKLGPDQRGAIGLFVDAASDAHFRNLIVTEREPGFLHERDAPMTLADARALVKPFYDLFYEGGSEEDVRAVLASDWKSYYSQTGFSDIDRTMEVATEIWPEMLPDARWTQNDIAVTNDNQIVVRGTLEGTPSGTSFFGAPVTGKSISIMTIDVHRVRRGKIVESHHVEDWARALRQVAAE